MAETPSDIDPALIQTQIPKEKPKVDPTAGGRAPDFAELSRQIPDAPTFGDVPQPPDVLRPSPDLDLSKLPNPDAPTPAADGEDIDKSPEPDLLAGKTPTFVRVEDGDKPAAINTPLAEAADDRSVQPPAEPPAPLETPETPEAPALSPEQAQQLKEIAEYAAGTNAREQERLEQRYGKGFIGKARNWLNNTGWGRAVKIAGKIAIGTGAAVAAGALTGGIGLVAAPLLYSLGAKTAVDGAIEAFQYYIGKNSGRNRRLKMEALTAANQEDASKVDISKLDERIASGELTLDQAVGQLNELTQQINNRENQIIASENDNIKWEAKQKMIRGLLSSVAALGAGILGGIPLGVQDFDNNGITHAVKLTQQGAIFLQNATNAIHALGHALPDMARVGVALGLGGLLAKTATEVFGNARKAFGRNRLRPEEMPQLIDPMAPPAEPNTPVGPDTPPGPVPLQDREDTVYPDVAWDDETPAPSGAAKVEAADAAPEASALPESQPLFEKPAEFSAFLKEIRERAYNLRQELADLDQKREELNQERQVVELHADSNSEGTQRRLERIENDEMEINNQINKKITELTKIRDAEELVNKFDEIDKELTELDQEWDKLDKKADSDKTYDEKQRIKEIVARHEELAQERSEIRNVLLEVYNNWGKTDAEDVAPEVLAQEAPIIAEPVAESEEEQAANLPPELAAEVESTPGELNVLSLESIREFVLKQEVESPESYRESLERVMEVLKNAEAIVELRKGVPTVVIPDLHGRRELLFNVLDQEIDGQTVIDLLAENKVNLVVLGDGMHTENVKADRWREIQGLGFTAMQNSSDAVAMETFLKAMDAEMADSLGTMKMVMDLKTRFPESFQYVRGNHDDVNNTSLGKNGVIQSFWVKTWLQERMGQGFIDQYSQFENSIPLVAVGENAIYSHTPPAEAMTAEQIRGKQANLVIPEERDKRGAAIHPGLLENRREPNEVVIEQVAAELGRPGAIWVSGHTPTENADGQIIDYVQGANGRSVRMNDPQGHVFAIIPPGNPSEVNPAENVRRM